MLIETTGAIRACRDPNDDMVLECAVNSGAEVVISGDKDLLSMREFQGVRILTPAEFVKPQLAEQK